MIAVAEGFDFNLTPELEAHEPPEARGLARDQVRMLVSQGPAADFSDTHFYDLPGFLQNGDVLVVNTSATLPAALTARTASGQSIEVHVSTTLPAGLHVLEPRSAVVERGDTLRLPARGHATLVAPYRSSARLWIATLELPAPLLPYLQHWGRPIRYPYVRAEWPLDMYQTVFALQPGSAEMPSAGRPFSAAVLAALLAKGIVIARVTLHCGVASPEHDEPPYDEYFNVPPETAAVVNAAKAASRHIVAVGTTVARALESALDERGRVVASRGWTDHMISARNPVRSFDALLTGFHEPRSTHLRLLEGLMGSDQIERAYRAALQRKFLWHEFGDVHLILLSS